MVAVLDESSSEHLGNNARTKNTDFHCDLLCGMRFGRRPTVPKSCVSRKADAALSSKQNRPGDKFCLNLSCACKFLIEFLIEPARDGGEFFIAAEKVANHFAARFGASLL